MDYQEELSWNYFEPFCTSSLDLKGSICMPVTFAEPVFASLSKFGDPYTIILKKLYLWTSRITIFEHFGISILGYKSILSKKNCCFCQILPF